MPELKRNFSAAKMNKDLDERLVPPGEYRDAKNIEIATSEGSNVGTVQNIKGNTEKTAAVSTAPTSSSTSHNFANNALCVASIADEKNNKIYSLIHDGLWFVAQDDLDDNNHLAISSDYILEYNIKDDSYKYVFNDIYNVHTTASVAATGTGNLITVNNTQGIRTGMFAGLAVGTARYGAKVKHTFGADTGNTTFDANKVFLETDVPAHVINTKVTFSADRVLNFNENTKITGLNILDDFLFWTDNDGEPKKISISRSLAGTGGSAHLPSPLTKNNDGDNRTYHTRLYTEIDPFEDIECATNTAVTIPIWAKEEHITVIKRAPLTPPILEMSKIGLKRKNSAGSENITYASASLQMVDGSGNIIRQGEIISLQTSTTTQLSTNVDWRDGDIIHATKENPEPIPHAIPDPTITFKVISTGANEPVTSPNALKNQFDLEVISLSSNTTTLMSTWFFALKIPEKLFEFKFVRFAYRYKYTDGEYSPFSPFSEVAFLPSSFSYKAADGYNLGMVNQIRGLRIKNYLPSVDQRPEDVVSVDILYKDDASPNVYTVKTLNRQDGETEGLQLVWPDLDPDKPYTAERGEFDITSEMIHAVVPSNQIIRPYDNVPRKALAQEVIGNRLVYGNYLQNYDVVDSDGELIKPEFELGFKSNNLFATVTEDTTVAASLGLMGGLNFDIPIPAGFTTPSEPKKSVKSLRTYQLGVVYCDKYGRQTPVLTDKATGSITIPKEFSDRQNLLEARIKTNPPTWSTHYKYYVKETSLPYYNLAMDRWYDAEDGNCWISFPSSERNKVDEDTFLILKKGTGDVSAVKEKARYKILAIENQAPDFIKTNFSSVGILVSTSASNYTTDDIASYPVQAGDGYPALDANTFKLDADAVEAKFGYDSNTNSIALLKYVDDNILSVQFNTADGGSGSEIYKISQIAKDTTSNSSSGHFYTFTVDSLFGADIEFLNTSANATTHNISFVKGEVENKPEFDGRFFVKILKDKALKDNVLEETNGNTYLIKYTRPIRHSSGGLNLNNQYNAYGATSAIGLLDPPADSTDGGSPPLDASGTGTFYYAQSEWKEDASTSFANQHGLGYYISTPLPIYPAAQAVYTADINGDANSFVHDNNGDTVGGTRRDKDYFEGEILNSWAIDNECAAQGGFGRGVHKNNQGVSSANYSTINNVAYYDPGYGNLTINDNSRILKIGDDSTGFDKSGENGRTGTSNTANTYPSDIYAEETHSVMHLSFFGIPFFEHLQGNLFLLHESTFIGELIKPGTLFKWGDDFDGTIYEVIWAQEQTGIRNYEGSSSHSNYNKDSNKRVRYSIRFKNHETGEESGFGAEGTGTRFHPLVNAVDETGAPVVTVLEGSNMQNAAGGNVEPFNYAGLAPNGSNYLNLHIVEPYYQSNADDKLSNPSPAIFETEPKESPDIDLYFEASTSYPVDITEETNEMLIPIGSTFTPLKDDYLANPPTNDQGNDILITYTITGWTDTDTFTIASPGINENSSILGDSSVVASATALNIITPYGNVVQVFLSATANSLDTSLTIHSINTGLYRPHGQTTRLAFSNCISFGNGVESDRIRDDFNAPIIAKGIKASTTLAERYREERRKHGLIYSGIYNSQSGVNNLNQFIAGEKITKDINPEYGSIQKIYSRSGDLLALCEDRVLKILGSNKDALYNADGNPQLISSSNVLGQAIPIPGEYGISTQPESFASYANSVFFTDIQRGSVMRLQGDSLSPISEIGMSDYFSDNLKDVTLWKCLGTYDENKLNYNLTIEKRVDGIDYGKPSFDTVTWSEKAKGWTSFKEFYPEQGISINNNYYTWYNGSMWQHDSNDTHNSFYTSITATVNGATTNSKSIQIDNPNERIEIGMIVSGTGVSDNVIVKSINLTGTMLTFDIDQTISDGVTLTFARVSSITAIFNDVPGSAKSFNTLSYEGSQSRIIENDEVVEDEYYNIDASTGWYCESITTDKQEGQVQEFIEKEGRWYNNIRGLATNLVNLDTSELSVQGIGVPSTESYTATGNFIYKFELAGGTVDPLGIGGRFTKNDFTFDAEVLHMANTQIDAIANPIFPHLVITPGKGGIEVSGASALNAQSSIHGKDFGIQLLPTLATNELTPENITINGDSGSDSGSGANLVRTITIDEDADGNANTNTLIEKVELFSNTHQVLGDYVNYGKWVQMRIFFNAVTPTTDVTITFDFD